MIYLMIKNDYPLQSKQFRFGGASGVLTWMIGILPAKQFQKQGNTCWQVIFFKKLSLGFIGNKKKFTFAAVFIQI